MIQYLSKVIGAVLDFAAVSFIRLSLSFVFCSLLLDAVDNWNAGEDAACCGPGQDAFRRLFGVISLQEKQNDDGAAAGVKKCKEIMLLTRWRRCPTVSKAGNLSDDVTLKSTLEFLEDDLKHHKNIINTKDFTLILKGQKTSKLRNQRHSNQDAQNQCIDRCVGGA